MAVLSIPGVSFTPAPKKEVTSGNYLTSSDLNLMNQYLPDLMPKEFNAYGNQSITGFLASQSKEYASNSDLIKWSEEGRLTKIYKGAERAVGTTTAVFSGADLVGHSLRVPETVLVYEPASGKEEKGIVTAVTADTVTIASTKAGGWSVAVDTEGLTLFAYGSEFRKGTDGMSQSLTTDPKIFENSPIIIKDVDIVSGSDMTQIGWIEIAPEYGGGYLWYLKDRSKTRQRFNDMLETAMLEGVTYEATSGAVVAGYKGTEGYFEAVSKGNIFEGIIDDITVDYAEIINRLDAQGAIAENLMYCKRNQDLAFDQAMAELNADYSGGAEFGSFDNSKDMALSLGFKSIMWGGYTFHKTAWKYLNDPTKRGAVSGLSAINGTIVPSGSTNVYDQVMGANVTLPFLHVKYREANGVSRKLVESVVGGAGAGVKPATSSLDANELHLLSERALCVLGRQNFFLLKAAAS